MQWRCLDDLSRVYTMGPGLWVRDTMGPGLITYFVTGMSSLMKRCGKSNCCKSLTKMNFATANGHLDADVDFLRNFKEGSALNI